MEDLQRRQPMAQKHCTWQMTCTYTNAGGLPASANSQESPTTAMDEWEDGDSDFEEFGYHTPATKEPNQVPPSAMGMYIK